MTSALQIRKQHDDDTPDFVQKVIDRTTALLRKHFPDPRPDADVTQAGTARDGLRHIGAQLELLARETLATAAKEGSESIRALEDKLEATKLAALGSQLSQELSVLNHLVEIAKLANSLPEAHEPLVVIGKILFSVRAHLTYRGIPLERWEAEFDALSAELEADVIAKYIRQD